MAGGGRERVAAGDGCSSSGSLDRVYHKQERHGGDVSLSTLVADRRKLIEENHYDSPRSLISKSDFHTFSGDARSSSDETTNTSAVVAATAPVTATSAVVGELDNELARKKTGDVVRMPPSISMGVWGEMPRGPVIRIKEDLATTSTTASSHRNSISARKTSQLFKINNCDDSGTADGDAVTTIDCPASQNYRQSWHAGRVVTGGKPKPDLPNKPIEIRCRDSSGRQTSQLIDDPRTGVLWASRNKSGAEPRRSEHTQVVGLEPRWRKELAKDIDVLLERKQQLSHGTVDNVTDEKANLSVVAGSGRRKWSDDRLDTTKKESQHAVHASLGDLRQLDGSRLVKGGDVGQLKEPPIQKHLVVRKKSRDTGVLTDDLGSQRSEDRRTETNIPTDQLLATTDDKRYISHNSLVERRISQLEAPAPPIPPPPAIVSAAGDSESGSGKVEPIRWDYKTSFNSFRKEKGRTQVSPSADGKEVIEIPREAPIVPPLPKDLQPSNPPVPPTRFYFGMNGAEPSLLNNCASLNGGGIDGAPHESARPTAVGKVKENQALSQPFRKPRELNEKEDKFSRPRLSTALFIQPYSNTGSHNNNSISTANNSINFPNNNNNTQNTNNNINFMSSNNNYSSGSDVVGRTQPRERALPAAQSNSSAATSSLPPPEPLQADINRAFTDQLMKAKQRLRHSPLGVTAETPNSAEINDDDDDSLQRQDGSPPPPPPPVLPDSLRRSAQHATKPLGGVTRSAAGRSAAAMQQPVDTRSDLLSAIRQAGGVHSLRKTRT